MLDFLQALVRHLRGPLLLLWDRLLRHRSRLVQDYIAGLQGWIHQAFLPPYAPDLSPVEFIWADWKQHELPNVCPQDYTSQSSAPYFQCTARQKPSDDRPPCLENPRPEGEESTLTENAPSPFHAEPRHYLEGTLSVSFFPSRACLSSTQRCLQKLQGHSPCDEASGSR